MLWRWAGWSAGIVLLIVSGLVLLLQVSVPGAGTPPRACGSAWDVVAGRAGWPQWQAADLSDPAAARDGRLVRTLRCPGAVNARIVTSGGLALGAVALVSAGEFAALRPARRAGSAGPGPARRLRLLGTAVTILGGVLTAAGLAAIALLVADPRGPLFVYVEPARRRAGRAAAAPSRDLAHGPGPRGQRDGPLPGSSGGGQGP